MHRTTIPLEGLVERELRRLATQERRSFKELVNDLLKRALKTYQKEEIGPTAFHWHTAEGKPAPWFDPSDRSTYLNLVSRKF